MSLGFRKHRVLLVQHVPTKCSAEIICSGCWLLHCSSLETPSSGLSGIWEQKSTREFSVSHPAPDCSFSAPTTLFSSACKQIIKKAGGHRANLLAPLSSERKREKSLSKAVSLAFVSSESAQYLRERQESCFEAFAPAMLLGLSKQGERGPQLK